MEYNKEYTKCIDCIHAVPDAKGNHGCSWSKHFIPVDGWKAEKQAMKIAKKPLTHTKS